MNEKAPERIYMHPTSAEANVNPWPLEPGEYVEYVRADLLATARKEAREAAWNGAIKVAKAQLTREDSDSNVTVNDMIIALERAAAKEKHDG